MESVGQMRIKSVNGFSGIDVRAEENGRDFTAGRQGYRKGQRRLESRHRVESLGICDIQARHQDRPVEGFDDRQMLKKGRRSRFRILEHEPSGRPFRRKGLLYRGTIHFVLYDILNDSRVIATSSAGVRALIYTSRSSLLAKRALQLAQ